MSGGLFCGMSCAKREQVPSTIRVISSFFIKAFISSPTERHKGSESGACSWGRRSRKPMQNGVPAHYSSTGFDERSFGKKTYGSTEIWDLTQLTSLFCKPT